MYVKVQQQLNFFKEQTNLDIPIIAYTTLRDRYVPEALSAGSPPPLGQAILVVNELARLIPADTA